MASAFSRIASFARRDHRYVLLGTSAFAAIGMMLSSQPRSPMSFLAHAFTVELVMYYLLVAWIVLSAVALVFKFTHWKTYAQTAPFTKPGVVRALRLGSYVIWAIVAVLVVDRVVLGFASAWAAAANATSMPKDMLVQVLYMFQQGKQTYIAGIVTTIELAEDLEAPVLQGQVVGEVVLKLDDKEVATYPIRAAKAVGAVNFGVAFRWLFDALLG